MMSDERRRTILAVISCVGAMLCFCSVPVVLRHLAGYLDHWTVNAVRYSTAAVFWLPATLWLMHKRQNRPTPGATTVNVWKAAIVPALCNILMQIGWTYAPYHAEASTVGFMVRTSFLFTVLLGIVFVPSERPLVKRPLFAPAILLSIAGVVIMYLGAPAGGSVDKTSAWGIPLILVTAFFWGAYTVSIRKYMHGIPFRLAFGVISLYSAATFVVLMFFFGNYGSLADLPVLQYVLLTSSGLLAIAFGHVLLYRGISDVGPIVATGITLISPFFTLLGAIIFLNERMTLAQLVGGIGVIAGCAVLLRAKVQASKLSPPPPVAGK